MISIPRTPQLFTLFMTCPAFQFSAAAQHQLLQFSEMHLFPQLDHPVIRTISGLMEIAMSYNYQIILFPWFVYESAEQQEGNGPTDFGRQWLCKT